MRVVKLKLFKWHSVQKWTFCSTRHLAILWLGVGSPVPRVRKCPLATTAIVTGVTDQEFVIRNHKSEVIILSDSISLSLITRQKFSQNKLLEISIFLSTFSNLTVLYFPGSGQFFADALSRQFDKIYLEDKSQNISKYLT